LEKMVISEVTAEKFGGKNGYLNWKARKKNYYKKAAAGAALNKIIFFRIPIHLPQDNEPKLYLRFQTCSLTIP
jgi:hypothetical protein